MRHRISTMFYVACPRSSLKKLFVEVSPLPQSVVLVCLMIENERLSSRRDWARLLVRLYPRLVSQSSALCNQATATSKLEICILRLKHGQWKEGEKRHGGGGSGWAAAHAGVSGPGHAADDLALQPGPGLPPSLAGRPRYLVPCMQIKETNWLLAWASQPWC